MYHLYRYATEWLKKHSFLEAGGVAITPSAELKGKRGADWVIHTASVGAYRYPHENAKFWFKRQITNILITAKELQARSIVMPLLGSGESNFPVDVVVEIISKTITEFHSIDSEMSKEPNAMGLWGKSTKLESITIVVWKNLKGGDKPEKNPSLKHFTETQ